MHESGFTKYVHVKTIEIHYNCLRIMFSYSDRSIRKYVKRFLKTLQKNNLFNNSETIVIQQFFNN